MLTVSKSFLKNSGGLGWLHMLKKMDVTFIEKQEKEPGEQTDLPSKEEGPNNTNGPFDKLISACQKELKEIDCWDSFLKHIYKHGTPAKSESVINNVLKEYNKKSEKGFVGLIQAAHSAVSGTEKNIPKGNTHYLKQTNTYTASPFGFPGDTP